MSSDKSTKQNKTNSSALQLTRILISLHIILTTCLPKIMEKELDKVIEEIMSTPNINGCLVADHQGLCLASKGSAHVDSAGIIVAISEQACKLQPNLKPPTVCLETEKKKCLIQRHGTITGAIYKQISSKLTSQLEMYHNFFVGPL